MNRHVRKSQDQERLSSLAERWHTLKRQGLPVSVEELCGGDAVLAQELQNALRAEQHLRQLGEPESPPTVAPSPAGETDGGAACAETEEVPTTGRYEVLGQLGTGGMGAVYLALDRVLGREVALKVIRPDALTEELRKRFLTEARAVAALDHPHIVKVFDVGEWAPPGGAPRPFLSLEFVSGGALSRRLGKGPMDPGEAARLVRLLARAMAHAHGRGIVHRDLKPDNVLMAEPADEPGLNCALGRPRVTDFGLARRQDAQPQTRTGAVMGTPSYMAPEQAEGLPSGPESDVYALGGILYRLLTGKLVFEGTTAVEVLYRVIRDAPVPPSRVAPLVPADLEALCLQCLAKDPADRPSAADLAQRLERFIDTQSASAGRDAPDVTTALLPPANPAVPRPTRRTVLAAGLGAVAILGLGGLAAKALLREKKTDPKDDETRGGDARPAELTGDLVVRVWGADRGARGLRIGLDEGAVPVKKGDQIQVEVKLSEPAYCYLLGIDGTGAVMPMHPWNIDSVKVRNVSEPAPELKSKDFNNPAGVSRGWKVDDTPGLETVLLLARRDPLPRDRDLGALLKGVKGAPLRDPGEVVYRAWSKGQLTEEAVFEDRNRGVAAEMVEIDDQLLQVVGRLSADFEMIRAVRFAHVAKQQ